MKIAFVGKGELSIQILNYLNVSDITDVIYFDDKISHDNQINFPFSDWADDKYLDYNFYFCLGYMNLQIKNDILSKATDLNRKITSYIHPTSYLSKSTQIGRGVFIFPCCNIDKGVIIEDGVLLNNSVVLSHDSIVKRSTYVSPGVIVCGRVQIGQNCFIGAGTIIANDIKIGNNVKIGAGSCITRDIPDNSCVIGNPMRFLKKRITLK